MNELYTLIVWSEPSKLFLSFSTFLQTNKCCSQAHNPQSNDVNGKIPDFFLSFSFPEHCSFKKRRARIAVSPKCQKLLKIKPMKVREKDPLDKLVHK